MTHREPTSSSALVTPPGKLSSGSTGAGQPQESSTLSRCSPSCSTRSSFMGRGFSWRTAAFKTFSPSGVNRRAAPRVSKFANGDPSFVRQRRYRVELRLRALEDTAALADEVCGSVSGKLDHAFAHAHDRKAGDTPIAQHHRQVVPCDGNLEVLEASLLLANVLWHAALVRKQEARQNAGLPGAQLVYQLGAQGRCHKGREFRLHQPFGDGVVLFLQLVLKLI
eukprot:scaffold24393_cov112-Isochrysis_galbana.AAC.11